MAKYIYTVYEIINGKRCYCGKYNSLQEIANEIGIAIDTIRKIVSEVPTSYQDKWEIKIQNK